MKVSVVNELTGLAEMVALPPGKNPVRIGSDHRNDVVLKSNSVKSQAAAILNEGRAAESDDIEKSMKALDKIIKVLNQRLIERM